MSRAKNTYRGCFFVPYLWYNSTVNNKRLDRRLKKIARVHAIATGALFAAYLGLSVIYSPEFLLSDIRDKFRALADDTITIVATVLGPPVEPVVTGTAVCDNGTLSVGLDWADDSGTETFDIDRDSLPLVTGLSASAYSDSVVAVATTYSYVVTAHGPMGPGIAVSNPVSVTTPAECIVSLPDPAVAVTAFQSRNIGSFDGIPSTGDRKPLFSGTTNIPGAHIDILINSSTVIAARVSANANGYWSFRSPIDLTSGNQTLFVTATDPSDASRTASASFLFRITKKDDAGDGDRQDTAPPSSAAERPVTGTVEPDPGPESEVPVGVPLSFALSVARDALYQGQDILTTIELGDLTDEYDGTDAVVRYTVFDERGEKKSSLLVDVVLRSGKKIVQNIPLAGYYPDGRYRVRAEILLDDFNVSRERPFTVLPLPLVDLGGGVMITYPELLSSIGTLVFWFLLLLLLWVFIFFREYWLSLHALRHITERHLERAGFFGMGRGVKH